MVQFEDQEIELFTDEMLIESVASALESACQEPQMGASLLPKRFSGKKAQRFPMELYVKRLLQYTDCSKSAFVTALLYMDRLHSISPYYTVNYLNVHRLFSTALLLAIKYHEDEPFGNTYYAEVFGMRGLDEINDLEAKLLSLLNFNLNVSEKEYVYFKSYLTQYMYRPAANVFRPSTDSRMLVTAA